MGSRGFYRIEELFLDGQKGSIFVCWWREVGDFGNGNGSEWNWILLYDGSIF